MAFIFRDATLADLDALTALEHRCFTPDIAFPRSHFRHSITRAKARLILCITADGELCGYGEVALPDNRTLAHLASLATDKPFRKQGIGAKLIARMEAIAQEHGYPGIALEVQADVPKLVSFYTDRGYVFSTLLPHYYPDGGDGLKLVKHFSRLRWNSSVV